MKNPNPLALLVPALSFGLLNAVTLDPLAHILTIAIALVGAQMLGVSWRRLWRVSWPLLVAAVTLIVVNTLADPTPGLGLADLNTGLTTAMRLLAIALPGLIAFLVIDPVELVDALVHFVHVPPRFGYGALAALRLMPTLVTDLHIRRLALRARGVAPAGVLAQVRTSWKVIVGLLVTAIRRATRLAVALDARGFDSVRRATSRPSRWSLSDTSWCLVAMALTGAVAATSILSGSWQAITGT